MKNSLLILTIFLLSFSCTEEKHQPGSIDPDRMMIRIAEIEVEPGFLEEYLSILKEESRASVALEPGVIAIYPMYQKERPTEIRLLEIYADKKAYENHLKTPHFQHYKTTTLNMVKSLKLVDMHAIDGGSMPLIFEKLN